MTKIEGGKVERLNNERMTCVIHHEGLTYIKEPVKIVDKEQVLHTKMIPIVKVLWRNHGVEEALWKAEQDMRSRYPHLFE